MEAGTYVIAQTEQSEEDERLGLLTDMLDGFTREYCTQVGIAPGWRCLEVGAGSGTVASWMANQVGETGHVTATDIDISRLAHLPEAGIEVHQHDITSGTVEHGAFDLTHCRVVLIHVPDPKEGLQNMLNATKPGGWLVVEDHDFALYRSATPDHPDAAAFDRASRDSWEALRERGVMHSYLGGEMLGLFDELAIEGTESTGRYQVIRGGDPQAQLIKMSHRAVAPLLIAAEVVDEETSAKILSLYDDPTFAFIPGLSTVTRGQRPS
ncbi:MAG: class I SAM-dependent methyltransferase [Acidimicrobiales bacterium]